MSRLGDILNAITSTKTGTITPKSGFTIKEPQCKERNGVVVVSGYVERSDGTTAIGTSEQLIATISGVTMPPQIIRKMVGSGVQAYSIATAAYASLNTSGEIRVKCANSTDRRVVFDFEYIVGG